MLAFNPVPSRLPKSCMEAALRALVGSDGGRIGSWESLVEGRWEWKEKTAA